MLYAKRFEDLPIVFRIGDIIRLHRATLRIFNNHRQFNVQMTWNGSWALFSTDKEPAYGTTGSDFIPVTHSGNKPTIEK